MAEGPLFTLEIGRVRIILSGDDRLQIQEAEPAFAPFVIENSPATHGDVALRLDLAATDINADNTFTRVFDSGASWSLWRRPSQRLIQLRSDDGLPPIRQLLIDKPFATGRLCCDPESFPWRDGAGRALGNPLRYPLDQVLLMHHLALRQGLILHSAGARMGRSGALFAGVSGAGKSTLARLLDRGGHRVLSDDRMVVRKTGSGYTLFGTPWPGDAGMAVNEGAGLTGLFFLHRGGQNRLVKLSRAAALRRLLPVASIAWYDAAMTEAALATCGAMLQQVPAFDLFFQPTMGVVGVLEEFQRFG